MADVEQTKPDEQPPAEEPISIGSEDNKADKLKTNGPSKLDRFKTWYSDRKKWTIPLTVIIFILLLAAIPITRYNIAGLVIKKDIAVRVLDDSANTPVSGAQVSLGSNSVQTDNQGVAILHKVKAGHHKVTVSKKYYKTRQSDILVPVLSTAKQPLVKMSATGRQVKITALDAVNKQPLANAELKIAGISAKTDIKGSALIVLPVGSNDVNGKLSLNGYNDQDVTVKVSNDKIQENTFNLVPSGKIYFLSKLSGKIDVVKTNLDGSNRQTVLAGTGSEDDRNTVLLASRDWKYLALLSRRAGNSASLYLIDTSNDNMTTIDSQAADYSLNGWVGDSFIYTLTRGDAQLWQAGRQVIKSYNATTKKSVTLDQTTASGSGQSDFLSQLVGEVYAYNDQVYYIMNWTSSFSGQSATDIKSKQATFNSIHPDGSLKKAIKSFGLVDGTQAIDVTLEDRVESPDQIDLKFSDGSKDNFYTYANGQVKDNPSMTADKFYSGDYPTYLESPDGNKTFWSDSRDGKNTLFIGDEDGGSGKQIATLSDYSPYGWYSNSYLLVSKNGSELYIMPQGGGNAIKITDYHKPAITFPGYGGGYGGL